LITAHEVPGPRGAESSRLPVYKVRVHEVSYSRYMRVHGPLTKGTFFYNYQNLTGRVW